MMTLSRDHTVIDGLQKKIPDFCGLLSFYLTTPEFYHKNLGTATFLTRQLFTWSSENLSVFNPLNSMRLMHR